MAAKKKRKKMKVNNQILVEKLIENNITLSLAESCTGGAISASIVKVPNCSLVFKGSAVVYCNKAKMDILGVEEQIIQQFSEVSPQCVEQMIDGTIKLYKSDFGLAISGYAGDYNPNEKDSGLIFMGIGNKNGQKIVNKYKVKSNREDNINQMVENAIELIYQFIFEK